MSSTADGYSAGQVNASRPSSRAISEAYADGGGFLGYEDTEPTFHGQPGPGAAIQPGKLALAAGGPGVIRGRASTAGASQGGPLRTPSRLSTPIVLDTDDDDTPVRKPSSFAKTSMSSQILLPGAFSPLKPKPLPRHRPGSTASDLSFNLSDTIMSVVTQENGAQLTAAQAKDLLLALEKHAKQSATHSVTEVAVPPAQQVQALRSTGR